VFLYLQIGVWAIIDAYVTAKRNNAKIGHF